jgi:hypothetical protein
MSLRYYETSLSVTCSTSVKIRILLQLCRPLLGLGRFLSFLILYTVGRTLWTSDQPVTRPLPTHRTTQTQSKRDTIQTSMPWAGFKPTIAAFERAKTVHALDRAATCERLKLEYRAIFSWRECSYRTPQWLMSLLFILEWFSLAKLSRYVKKTDIKLNDKIFVPSSLCLGQ